MLETIIEKCSMDFQWVTSSGLCTHTFAQTDRLSGNSLKTLVLPNLHAAVCVDDLNAMVLKVGVIFRHRQYRTFKTSVNAGIAKLVNWGTGMDLARGDRCDGVTKGGLIKKQNTRLNFYVTNMIIGGDSECAANNETLYVDTELLAQGLAYNRYIHLPRPSWQSISRSELHMF